MNLFIASLFLLIASTSHGGGKEVIFAADPWCPYTCEVGPNPGILVEIADKILTSKGYKLTYKIMAWSRALEETKSGKIDGALGAGGGDAKEHTLVDPPISAAQSCFYTRTESTWKYNGPATLEKIVLGVPQDYAFGVDDLDAYIKNNTGNPKKIDAITGDDILSRNSKKLLGERIDAFIDDVYVVQYHLKNNPNEKLRQAGCLADDPVTIALSKKKSTTPELNKILSEGIKAMKENGEIKKIMAKYGI